MFEALICDAIRTPIGRYGGALSGFRADDLAALPIKALMTRHPGLDWSLVDEVIYGCANQAGEDNRNVARMAGLLSGLAITTGGTTINRLCGSGMDAVGSAARAIRTGEAHLLIAGGVESMSRAPFVLNKSDAAFSRDSRIYDTTIGWRFVNARMEEQFGVDSMPETAENVAEQFDISRHDQDSFAVASQAKALAAQEGGRLAEEICPVSLSSRKGEITVIDQDEHPRVTSLDALARLKSPFRSSGSVTAGNASGVNDGAAALLLSSPIMAERLHLTPMARILGMATAGVHPRIMGIGPVPASLKLLDRLGLTLADMDVIEINEAFAAQALACIRQLRLADDDERINPNGGAIALGHPLGMSGARLIGTAARQLKRTGGRLALASMCIGVGQGIAMVIESL